MQTLCNFFGRITLAIATLCIGLGAAMADTYPNAPVRWIVPYPAGGGTDVVARQVSNAMQPQLGQPLVVDNRPGAGTGIGMSALVSAPADGYTVATADVATMAFNPSLYAKLPYDPHSSFVFIGGLARTPFVLVVRQDLPVNSVKEFLALARQQPGKLTYGSAGAGSPHHIAMEMLQQRANIQMIHIPYKGGAPALQDLMSGQFDAMMLDLPGFLANKSSGRFKTLGVALPARHPLLPNVPTLDESGLNGVVAYSWQILVAKAGTPTAVVDRLAKELHKALQEPGVREKLIAVGADPLPLSPGATQELVKSESLKWAPVIKAADIKLD